MKKNIYYILLLSAITSVAFAEEIRQVDKHEHGTGELNIAVEGDSIELEFILPGFDVVGFEYKASSETDIAKIRNALMTFKDPDNMFLFPDKAQCALTGFDAKLIEEHEDEHEHDHEDEHEHKDEHEHEDESEKDSHSAFYAKYSLNCEYMNLLLIAQFTYFDSFSNSSELEIQFVSKVGSTSFEIDRELPFISLEGKI